MPGSAAAAPTLSAAISAWRASVTCVVVGPIDPALPSNAVPAPPVGAPYSVIQIGISTEPWAARMLRRLSGVSRILFQAVAKVDGRSEASSG